MVFLGASIVRDTTMRDHACMQLGEGGRQGGT